MKVIGIIVEYNPLQNGHEYQIKLAKEKYNADYVVLIMTGNFNERGIPAIMPKCYRAEHAIQIGADVVIELPVCYSISDLPLFAFAAIKLLDALGVVDNILFGSEIGNIDDIVKLALLMNSDEYLKKFMNSSKKRNFNKRIDALKQMGYHKYAEYINQPNNLLGINYIQALRKINSNIIPLTHQRIGQAYMDYDIPPTPKEKIYSSASAVRKTLSDAWDKEEEFPIILKRCLPESVFTWMKKNWNNTFPIFFDDFWKIIKCKINSSTIKTLAEIDGMNEEIASLMKETLKKFDKYNEFKVNFEDKVVNVNLERRLFRILTEQKKSDIKLFINNGTVFFARILAINSEAEDLINKLKSKASVVVFNDGDNIEYLLKDIEKKQLCNDNISDSIYEQIYCCKFQMARGEK